MRFTKRAAPCKILHVSMLQDRMQKNRPVDTGRFVPTCVRSFDLAMTPRGFEQPSKTSGDPHSALPPNTESNTVDPDLQTVIDAWANLPVHLRRTIAVHIDASKPGVTE